MISLLLTILCSTSIAIILKINSNKDGDAILLLAGNYLTASVLGLIIFLAESNASSPINLIPFAILVAVFFVGSFFVYSKSVSLSGAALSTLSSRLSMFVPILLSILFYNEFLAHLQLLGIILTIITITLFYFSVRNSKNSNNNFVYLTLVLFGIGFGDFFMKVFQENWSNNDKPWFLFWLFFFSFIISFIAVKKNKVVFNKKTFYLGLFLGIPNIFSSFFLIEALKTYKAVLVYPIVNLSIIILTATTVRFFWDEKWNLLAKLAFLVGLISILLLSL